MEESADTGEASQALVGTNQLAMNQLAMNQLAPGALELNTSGVETLSDTEDGRTFLRYLARCALAADQSLVVVDRDDLDGDGDDTEELYRFDGSLGLAPEWVDASLSPSGQRWISACLLAHVNAFGVPVPISLRGDHPSLTISQQEKKDFPVQEAAFYGDLFQDLDGDNVADFLMYGCRGQVIGEHADSPYLAQRACATPSGEAGVTQCGFVDVGVCHASPTRACASGMGQEGGYRDCYSEARGAGGWPATAERYDEVITVYLLAE